jgi:hypothetical protein
LGVPVRLRAYFEAAANSQYLPNSQYQIEKLKLLTKCLKNVVLVVNSGSEQNFSVGVGGNIPWGSIRILTKMRGDIWM